MTASTALRVGRVVAAHTISVTDFVSALAGRNALVLCPTSAQGWFGGTAVVAWDPVLLTPSASMSEAGRLLEAALACTEPCLAAAVVTYEGEAALARYAGGLLLAEAGWRAWGDVSEDLSEVLRLAALKANSPSLADQPVLGPATWDMLPRDYRSKVREAKERIAAGDVYVLNLTARLTGPLVASPAESFATLYAAGGSDMSAWIESGEAGWTASVSPERFVSLRTEVDGRRIAEICPIKGTRPRGAGPAALPI